MISSNVSKLGRNCWNFRNKFLSFLSIKLYSLKTEEEQTFPTLSRHTVTQGYTENTRIQLLRVIKRTQGYSYSGLYREHKDTVTQGYTGNTRIQLLRVIQRTQRYSYWGLYREHKDTVTEGYTENTRIQLLRGIQTTLEYSYSWVYREH